MKKEKVPSHNYKVGDPIPTMYADKQGNLIPENWTVLEILSIPDTEDALSTLVRNTIDSYYSKGRTRVSVISGKNLADRPEIAPFVELDKIYVMEV